MGWEDTIEDDAAAEAPAEQPAENPEPSTVAGWESTIQDDEPSEDIGPDSAPGKYVVKDPLSAGEWWKAAKDTWNNPDPSAKAAMNGALPHAAGQAVSALAGPVSKFIGNRLGGGMQAAAKSPIPEKLASMTDVSSKMGGGGMGRLGAYSVPGVNKVQAFSDSMRGVSKAQSVASKLLQNAPEKLGKFAQILSEAAARGGPALGTADFILSQRNADYQKIKKDASNEE